MLLDAKIRSDFNIELISANPTVGGTIKAYLSLAGYQVTWVKEEPSDIPKKEFPHLTIIDLAVVKNLAKLIEARLAANSESLFVLIAPPGMASKVEPFREQGVYGIMSNSEGLDVQSLMLVDLICSELFLRYQNEQLSEQLQDLRKKFETDIGGLTDSLKTIETQSHQLTQSWDSEKKSLMGQLETRTFEITHQKSIIEELTWLARPLGSRLSARVMQEQAEPISQLIHELETDLGSCRWNAWYLKFMPEIQAFVLTQYRLDTDTNKSRAIQFKPQKGSVSELMNQLVKGETCSELNEVFVNTFGEAEYRMFPLGFGNHIDGIFCFSLKAGTEQKSAYRRVELLMQVFMPLLAYYRGSVQSSLHQNKIDEVTQFELREAYFERLNGEFARSRRLGHSISVVKLSIDSFNEIELVHGQDVTKILLAQTATAVRSSSRINDVAYRTGHNEISLILPHTPLKGAAIRAERLRRIIEMHEFIGYPPGHITVSLGISEYPTLVDTVENLDRTTEAALGYIQKKSLNKVCLYSPGAI